MFNLGILFKLSGFGFYNLFCWEAQKTNQIIIKVADMMVI